MNYLSRAAMLDVSGKCPAGLRIGYIAELNSKERKEIEDAINYWLNSTAITEGSDAEKTLTWNGTNDTVDVYADFSKGNFNGNLLHHNAIEYGDDDFEIGLLKVLSFGHTPKTDRGTTIPHPTYYPFYVQFIYNDAVKKAEKNLREEYRKLLVRDLLDDNRFIKETLTSLRNIETELTAKCEVNNVLLEALIDSDY